MTRIDGGRNGRGLRVEAWLASDGMVLAASERAARSVAGVFHAARRAEGRMAWPTPAIFAWDGWIRQRWLERNRAGVMLLNPSQEQALWTRVIGQSRAGKGLLGAGRLAVAAQQAYRLLCDYAPDALRTSARMGWTGDAAVFSEWMDGFASYCRREGAVSGSRIALDLADMLRGETGLVADEESPCKPLLLVGFDRLLKTQQYLLDAWGTWQQDEPGERTSSAELLAATDSTTEIAACVQWLRAKLAAEPESRLMVVVTRLPERRGELERALLDVSSAEDAVLDFEFSLGVPLGQVGLVRSAILLLRWLNEPLSETELDWLITSGHCARDKAETIVLAEAVREIRRCDRERPAWQMDEWASAIEDPGSDTGGLPAPTTGARAWMERLLSARDKLREISVRQIPLEWVSTTTQLLNGMGWPGFRPLYSVAFQALQRWERALEDCGSLGFDGSKTTFAEFVSTLAATVSSTIFAEESRDARVQITEPLESAGQLADGIWFLGANEENWPGRGQPHPLLPIGLQWETGMPHASPQADWELAQRATERLLTSADEVVFSYARHAGEIESRPSRMVLQIVGSARALSSETRETNRDITERFEDWSMVPYPRAEIMGGAGMLTRQSLCPFQAFATTRLDAEDWESADVGLNARQRGQLLHAVMHRVWSGTARGGISTLAELQAVADLRRFVTGVVRTAMQESFDPKRRSALPARFPARYLELEEERLTQIVTEWLEYERERLPFAVAGTEVKREVTVAGLKMKLRLDRIDQLPDGTSLVIDYKSSNVGPSAWADERPDDVQLPLYATYAMPDDLEGLVFARIRPGDMKFCGHVRDAAGSLRGDLSKQNTLVKNPLTNEQLEEWSGRIERLGEDFLAGRADVNPKDPVKTCRNCHLHAVCRVYENQPLSALLEDDRSSEASSEENGGGGDA